MLGYITGSKDERVVITALGGNKVGILAGLTSVLSDAEVNILDISQTILQEFFTMIMIVDLKDSKITINELRERLTSKGAEMDVEVTVQKADIFKHMHRV